jgi:hypothetical protein
MLRCSEELSRSDRSHGERGYWGLFGRADIGGRIGLFDSQQGRCDMSAWHFIELMWGEYGIILLAGEICQYSR